MARLGRGRPNRKVVYYRPQHAFPRVSRLSAVWPNVATSQVNMMHIGDSITEGYLAGSFEAKYTTRLLRMLQRTARIEGGNGFHNSAYAGASVDNELSSYWSPTATSGGTEGFLADAYGQWTTNTAVTVNFTGTSFGFGVFAYGSGITYSISVDGGGASTFNVPYPGFNNYQAWWYSAVGSPGAHSAVITPGSGQAPFITGIHVFNNDEGIGIHGWEGGHYGTSTTDQVNSKSLYYHDASVVLQPAVVTLFLGLNDWNQNLLPATYQANLQTIVDTVNGYCNTPPSWVICGIYTRTDTPTPTYPLSTYTTAAQNVANGDTINMRFVDLNTVIGTGDLQPDGVHLLPGGDAKVANAIYPAILDLAGGAVAPVMPQPINRTRLTMAF